jgi:hypothetical protein
MRIQWHGRSLWDAPLTFRIGCHRTAKCTGLSSIAYGFFGRFDADTKVFGEVHPKLRARRALSASDLEPQKPKIRMNLISKKRRGADQRRPFFRYR